MEHCIAELPMYVAPEEVRRASERWLTRIAERLNVVRLRRDVVDLHALWQAPHLLLAQTCGYPLVTQLRDTVRLIGRPSYHANDESSDDGWHCSVLLCRTDDSRRTGLANFYDCRAVINSRDSNSGMNLLRLSVAPWQRSGRFFASVDVSGAHVESIRRVRSHDADLAAIDSVTYGYIARFAPQDVSGLHIVARSAASPTLPFIGALDLSDKEAVRIREAMNAALDDLPDVRDTLGIRTVLPASITDYDVLLEYERQAASRGYPVLR